MPAPYLNPAQNGQRDQITQALMQIANPPPQMPQQQPGMASPMGGAPQANVMPPQPGPPQGAPVGAPQPPMMAGALGGVMPQQPQQQQPQQPPMQMPPQGM